MLAAMTLGHGALSRACTCHGGREPSSQNDIACVKQLVLVCIGHHDDRQPDSWQDLCGPRGNHESAEPHGGAHRAAGLQGAGPAAVEGPAPGADLKCYSSNRASSSRQSGSQAGQAAGRSAAPPAASIQEAPPKHVRLEFLVSCCACAQVTGTFERGKQKLSKPVLSGKWDEGMVAERENGSTVQMWRKNPPPPDPTRWVCLKALPQTPLMRAMLLFDVRVMALQAANCSILQCHSQISCSSSSCTMWRHQGKVCASAVVNGGLPSSGCGAPQVQPVGLGHQAERDHAGAGAEAGAHRLPAAPRPARDRGGRL